MPQADKLLIIDVGNTRLKWALYAENELRAPTSNAAQDDPQGMPQAMPQAVSQGVCFLENIDQLADNEWAKLTQQHGAPSRMVGCVVAGDAIKRRVHEQMEPWDLESRYWVAARAEECGVSNQYDHPTRLGADRWVALIGARQYTLRHWGGAPVLLVMAGTAVTVEALDGAGRFLGGLIMPGHGIMLKALESGTAGLHVPTGEVREFPTNTSDALTTGGNYAILGAVERMYQNLQHTTGSAPKVLMTGGAAWKLAPAMTLPHTIDESLIFDGLLAVAQARSTAGLTP